MLHAWVRLYCLQTGGLLTKNLAIHHLANKKLFISSTAK